MMKKLPLIAMVFLFSLSITHAQKLSVAPELGLSLSSLAFKNTNAEVSSMNVNANIGINVYTPLYKRFKLGTGIFYNSMNASYQSTADKISGTVNSFSMYYLRVPLNVVYQKTVSKGLLLFNTGLWMSYNLGGDVTVYERNRPLTGEELLHTRKMPITFGNSTNETTPIGLGWNAGISYKFPIGIFMNFQYNLGLSKFNVKDMGSVQNQFASLGVGYVFNWK